MATDVRWTYDTMDEDRLLHHWGIQPTPITVSLADINWDASLRNQNRGDDSKHPLDKAHVSDLAASMVNGDLLPAITVRNNGRGLYIIDGNHRATAANDLGEKEASAWLVDCDDETADAMCEFANLARHGKAVPAAQRMKVAQKWIALGMLPDDVCRRCGITRNSLEYWQTKWRAEGKIDAAIDVRGKPLTVQQTRAINRLEVEELRVLGHHTLTANQTDLDEWTREIAAASPSERMAVTYKVLGCMEAEQKSKSKVTGAKATPLTEAKRAVTILKRNLEKAMIQSTPQQKNAVYDDIHELYLKAQSLRGADDAN